MKPLQIFPCTSVYKRENSCSVIKTTTTTTPGQTTDISPNSYHTQQQTRLSLQTRAVLVSLYTAQANKLCGRFAAGCGRLIDWDVTGSDRGFLWMVMTGTKPVSHSIRERPLDKKTSLQRRLPTIPTSKCVDTH